MAMTKKEKAREEYLRNKDRYLARAKKWAIQNPDKRKSIRKKWRDANYEKARSIEITSAKKHRPKKSQYQRRYRQDNPGLSASYCAKRRAAQLEATPKWLTENQRLEIEQIYIQASELSWLSEGGLHVDHIVPLQGKEVRGLHVPWNLQILPAPLNFSKSNKLL